MSQTRERSLQPLVSHFHVLRPCPWDEIFSRQAPLVVEIGFGLGEVLSSQAKTHPDKNFIGIETNWERIYKTLKRLERDGVNQRNNVRIFRLDATVMLERLFEERTIDDLYCLFPCPWPKKKHEKYRLFSQSSLQLINNRLKNKASVKIVTDHYPYVQWIEEEQKGSGFSFEVKNINARFDTKFEKKWRLKGQETFFEINLIKKKHISIPVKKDVSMKSYKLNSFDPNNFVLEEQKGDVTVVPRNTFYDENKQTMLVQTLVAEENLTQDFWVAIVKKEKGWLLKKAEGHYFFPTPGIKQALKLIYEQARKNT